MLPIGAGAVVVSALAGRGWLFALRGLMSVLLVAVHGWWLPRNGVNGWAGESCDRFDALRGWKT